MRKVLMVSCEGLGHGGVQAIMMGIVKNLSDDYKFDMLLFTGEKRFYDDEFLKYGGVIHRIPRYEGRVVFFKKLNYYIRGFKVYYKVLRVLSCNEYNIIHCNDEFESAPIIKAAHKMNIPVRIVHTHVLSRDSNFLANILNGRRKKEIEKYASTKIGCSKEACESFFLKPQNAKIINNFYNDSKFCLKKIEKKPFRILQVGSYSEIKNQLFSLDIIYFIKKIYPDIKFDLVGFSIGDYESRIKQKVKECGLTAYVTFHRSDADIPYLLEQSAAFLFPSLHEGFGIALIEAQALGVRCYTSSDVPKTTNCGGVQYLRLEDGAEQWAKIIMSDYECTGGIPQRYDVSHFAESKIMNIYRQLYKGESK